jgi:dsRNA-specific ribonuclease
MSYKNSSPKDSIDVSYILNENNKLITPEYITSLLGNYGINIKVNNLNIFQEAMIHLSYLVRNEEFYKSNKTKAYQIQSNDIEPLDSKLEAIPLQSKSYERLEFVGDAVIHSVLAEYLFKRYPYADEGFMTKLRTKIENGNTLYLLSKKIGLNEFVLISRYVEKNGGRTTNENVLEDIFEAFIGALKLDAGYDVCDKFLITLIEKEINLAYMLNEETNFKEKLLQYFHMRKWQDPKYDSMSCEGPENKKLYTMYVKCIKNVHDTGEVVGIGTGSSKKMGEQDAAKQAMIKFGIYRDGNESDEEIEELDDDEFNELIN